MYHICTHTTNLEVVRPLKHGGQRRQPLHVQGGLLGTRGHVRAGPALEGVRDRPRGEAVGVELADCVVCGLCFVFAF